MIISRTPLRVSFVGGGSDLPSYYLEHGGRVISMAINKYVYVGVNKSFSDSVRVAYSKVEECQNFENVQHPLVRNCAKLLELETGLEITSTADIPARGTGLGSSSSFTVGLLNALSAYRGKLVPKEDLAESACKVEITMCGEPIGKQDQFAAALGNVNIFNFNTDNSVDNQRVEVSPFNENLFLGSMLVFYTGVTRSASSVLADQNANTASGAKLRDLKRMVELVEPFSNAMSEGDIKQCGEILDLNWNLKKNLSKFVSNPFIDEIYEEAMSAGALGGKLLGAGAGGFMLFLAPQSEHHAIAQRLYKLKQQFWGLDRAGTSIIYQS